PVDGAVGGSQQDAHDRGSERGSLREQRAVAVFHDEDVGIGSRQRAERLGRRRECRLGQRFERPDSGEKFLGGGADNEDGTTWRSNHLSPLQRYFAIPDAPRDCESTDTMSS